MQIINHIEIKDGTAVIRGRGALKVKMVARMYLWDKQSISAVMDHYDLTAAEVHSAIAFYLDNQAVFDAEYEDTVSKHASEALTLDSFKAKFVEPSDED